jgi:hypothetical protein
MIANEANRAFCEDVLLLVAELTRRAGPCLPFEVEQGARRQAVSEFWARWLHHPCRIGDQTPDRLEALEEAILERGWLKHHNTVESAVTHLREAIRRRSKPAEDLLPLFDHLLPSADQADPIDLDLSSRVEALPEPERSFLVARMTGETWEQAAARLGHDRATWRRCQYSLQNKFPELRSYGAQEPRRVRAR